MMKENDLINLLREVKKVLEEHNIEFWLDCGTLLGAVRDGDFLPWEKDIDLGAWYDSFSDNLKMSISKELCDRGFKVHISQLVNHMNIRKKGKWIDINLYRLIDNKAIWPMLTNPMYKFLNYFSHVLSSPHDYEVDKGEPLIKRVTRRIVVSISCTIPPFWRKPIAQTISNLHIDSNDVLWIVPSSYFLNLSTIKFYGMEFKVPGKTEEYLIYRYGNDWRKPKKNWVTRRDDGAISSNREMGKSKVISAR